MANEISKLEIPEKLFDELAKSTTVITILPNGRMLKIPPSIFVRVGIVSDMEKILEIWKVSRRNRKYILFGLRCL